MTYEVAVLFPNIVSSKYFFLIYLIFKSHMTFYGQLNQLMHHLVNLTIMVNLPLWCISSSGQLTFDDALIEQLQVHSLIKVVAYTRL